MWTEKRPLVQSYICSLNENNNYNNYRFENWNDKKTSFRKQNKLPSALKCDKICLKQYALRLIYLLLLYSIIGIICAIYMYVLFYFTIYTDYPRLTGLNNQLKLNPGLSMVPNPSYLTSLIYISMSNPVSYNSLIDEMTAFLSHYHFNLIGGMFAGCEDDPKYLVIRRPCRFNLDVGGPCNLKSGYGYGDGKPCFAIKINRIYGWLPDLIKNSSGIMLKCEGLTDMDSLYLGKVCYYDTLSLKHHNSLENNEKWCDKNYGLINSVFYPYLNQGGYQSPLVFVQFPFVKRHVIIWIKCYAMAKNIKVDVNQMEGSIVFQILVE